MLCVSIYASAHYLTSFNTATTLISQAGENDDIYCLVCEALLTSSEAFEKGRFDSVLKATSGSCTVGDISSSKLMDLNRVVKQTTHFLR